jgi:putative SOS response-associated peptidase YedK
MCNLCRLEKGQDALPANAVVAPIHSKAMPVLLTTPEEQDAWLSAPLEPALKLQRPLPDDALRMVALVEKADELVPATAAAQ